MKKNTIIIFATIIVIVLLISSIVVYAQNEKTEPTLEDKVTEEISYLNNYIISLLGHFNGITLGNDTSDKLDETKQIEKEDTNMQNSENNTLEQNGNKEQGNESKNSTENASTKNENKTQSNILANKGKFEADWIKIEEKIERLYQTWNTISIDLHALNIDGKAILEFSNKLNFATQYVKKQDKEKAMQELTSIYSLLPQYMQSYKPDTQETKMLEIQSHVISSYTATTSEKWSEAEEQLTNAEQKFATIINTVSDQEQDQIVMNQCYILVNELRNAAILKDKDIFYIQFQNFIKKMNTIKL